MRGRSAGVVVGAVLGLLAATGVAVPEVSAAPEAGVRVDVRDVSVIVDGETATGRVYEPYRERPGDTEARDLIVAVHGHAGSAADFEGYMSSIVRNTGAPLITMDQRSAESVWRTGEWNVWAGWRDTVTATQWYRGAHPAISRTVLWGWSQGGVTSGLAAAYAPAGTYDYWVDTFGQSGDFTGWLEAPLAGPSLRPEIERDAGGCTPLTCPQAYADRTPTLLAGRMTIKRALLIHGTADALVPYASGLETRAAMTLTGKPVSMYTVVSGRDLDGSVVPGGHGLGPVFYESGCVVQRLLLNTEPLGGDHDYLIDIAQGIDTAPPSPPNTVCGG